MRPAAGNKAIGPSAKRQPPLCRKICASAGTLHCRLQPMMQIYQHMPGVLKDLKRRNTRNQAKVKCATHAFLCSNLQPRIVGYPLLPHPLLPASVGQDTHLKFIPSSRGSSTSAALRQRTCISLLVALAAHAFLQPSC